MVHPEGPRSQSEVRGDKVRKPTSGEASSSGAVLGAVTARGAGRELVGGTAEPSRQRSTRAELAELGGRGISRRTGVQTCVQVRTGEYR